MKEYTSALLKVLKAGKISVADAERYVAEAERLLRAETTLCEQEWPEGRLDDEVISVFPNIRPTFQGMGATAKIDFFFNSGKG